MRRHDSSSGEMEDAPDNTPAVDSANEDSVAKAKARHVRIPPPKHVSNGIKGNSISPQPAAGKQSRPQSANRGSAAPVRYFILKSYNRENVERSIDQGVWSTQVSIHSSVQESRNVGGSNHLYSRLMDRHMLISGKLSLLATGHVMAQRKEAQAHRNCMCTVLHYCCQHCVLTFPCHMLFVRSMPLPSIHARSRQANAAR